MPEAASQPAEARRFDATKLELACYLKWSDPKRKWEDIANEVGISERQLRTWRASEEWEVIDRRIGQQAVLELAKEAVAGYKLAFRRGKMTGGEAILRAAALIVSEHAPDGSSFVLNIPQQLEPSEKAPRMDASQRGVSVEVPASSLAPQQGVGDSATNTLSVQEGQPVETAPQRPPRGGPACSPLGAHDRKSGALS